MTTTLRIHLITSGIATVANLARQTGIERTRLNRALNGDLKLRDDEQRVVETQLGMPLAQVFASDTT